jgi:hypothetical protein
MSCPQCGAPASYYEAGRTLTRALDHITEQQRRALSELD